MADVGDARTNAGECRGEVLKDDQRVFQLISQFGYIRTQGLICPLYVPLCRVGWQGQRTRKPVSMASHTLSSASAPLIADSIALKFPKCSRSLLWEKRWDRMEWSMGGDKEKKELAYVEVLDLSIALDRTR